MSTPLISVIIPCYNSENFLPNCFKCLDKQTYKNIHVIFINDGSTDNTLKLLEEYCAIHPDYTLISGENCGVASARNKGLAAIKGEFFAFYDSDDLISDGHYERLAKNLQDNAADLAVCGIKRISEKKAAGFKTGGKIKAKKVRIYGKTAALEQFFSQEKFDFLLVNKLFKTDIFKKSGARFLEGCHYGEEGYFFYKYLSQAEKTVYDAAKTYVYVQNKHSLMHSAFSEKRLGIYENIGAILGEIAEKKEFSSVIPYIKVMRAGYSVGILYFILRSKYKNACVIASVVKYLKKDVKSLKKSPKVAFYKKALLPLCAAVSGVVFKKYLKQARTPKK